MSDTKTETATKDQPKASLVPAAPVAPPKKLGAVSPSLPGDSEILVSVKESLSLLLENDHPNMTRESIALFEAAKHTNAGKSIEDAALLGAQRAVSIIKG